MCISLWYKICSVIKEVAADTFTATYYNLSFCCSQIGLRIVLLHIWQNDLSHSRGKNCRTKTRLILFPTNIASRVLGLVWCHLPFTGLMNMMSPQDSCQAHVIKSIHLSYLPALTNLRILAFYTRPRVRKGIIILIHESNISSSQRLQVLYTCIIQQN